MLVRNRFGASSSR